MFNLLIAGFVALGLFIVVTVSCIFDCYCCDNTQYVDDD